MILPTLLLCICVFISSFATAIDESVLLDQPRHVIKQEGESIDLVCGVDSSKIDVSNVTDILWGRYNDDGNFEFIVSEPPRIVEVSDKTKEVYKKTLTINHLEKRDERDYGCIIHTADGGITFYIKLDVNSVADAADQPDQQSV